MKPISLLNNLKFIICFFVFLAINSLTVAQSKPYSNGTYNFGVFDIEYGRTTARCKVFIDNDWAIVKVIEPLMEGIFSVNEIIFSGRIYKYNGLYYIVENGKGPGSVDDFEYETPRIDFNRKLVIQ